VRPKFARCRRSRAHASPHPLPAKPTARYIDRADEADELLEDLRGVAEIALDTEGASFHRFLDRIYLLQISTRTADIIIDPLAAGPLPGITAILADPAVEVVFHDADYDLRLLRQDYGVRALNIFDTRVAAQLLGIRSFGLAALLEKYFDVRLEKKYQRADWSLRPLTQAMLEYAVLDTHYLLPLRDRLREELEKLGRWEWAREEFARVEADHAAAESDDPTAAFFRVKGARDLTRRELAILRELVPWRDSVARRLDRATFRVAGNDILLEIARTRPHTIDELSRIRIVPRVLVERSGRDILDAVRAGEAVPESELPRFPRGQRWARDPDYEARVDELRRIRESAAARLNMDPGVLCSRDRLEAIARVQPRTIEELRAVPGLRNWQIEALGGELLYSPR
jgi:ribonuclease D